MSKDTESRNWWVRKPIEWIVVAALGFGAAMLLEYISASRLAISYSVASSSLIDPVVAERQLVRLKIGDVDLEAPHFSVLRVSNSGNRHISDLKLFLECGQPIRSRFLATDRPAIREGLRWGEYEGGVTVTIPTLNTGDSLEFVVVHDEALPKPMVVDTTTEGVRMSETTTAVRSERTPLKVWFVVAYFALASAYTLVFWLRKSRSSRLRREISRLRHELANRDSAKGKSDTK